MNNQPFRTGLHEDASGFVGQTWSINAGMTKGGRPFLEFDIFCGLPAPEYNRIPTVRHVVVFDEDAAYYKDIIRQGTKVEASGFVRTEEYEGKDGLKKKVDKLIVDVAGAMRVIEDKPAELTRA